MKKERILISSCLLGAACRYDGLSKPCCAAEKLQELYDCIPVCPEQAGKLPTPRIPAERIGNRVVTKNGKDVTKAYRQGAEYVLSLCEKYGIKTAVLKERSPSCGKGKIYDGSFTQTLTEGNGVCCELLLKNGIRVLGESEIERLLYEKRRA